MLSQLAEQTLSTKKIVACSKLNSHIPTLWVRPSGVGFGKSCEVWPIRRRTSALGTDEVEAIEFVEAKEEGEMVDDIDPFLTSSGIITY